MVVRLQKTPLVGFEYIRIHPWPLQLQTAAFECYPYKFIGIIYIREKGFDFFRCLFRKLLDFILIHYNLFPFFCVYVARVNVSWVK